MLKMPLRHRNKRRKFFDSQTGDRNARRLTMAKIRGYTGRHCCEQSLQYHERKKNAFFHETELQQFPCFGCSIIDGSWKNWKRKCCRWVRVLNRKFVQVGSYFKLQIVRKASLQSFLGHFEVQGHGSIYCKRNSVTIYKCFHLSMANWLKTFF